MTPIIKWAGGKRQLLPELKINIPNKFGTYVEPFLGSGALFFDINPDRAILNDFNPELINVYKQVRDNLKQLGAFLIEFQEVYNSLFSISEKSDYFYEKRDEFNEHILDDNLSALDAALFILLNKTCYNGLYRVNAQGLFNTPFGKKNKINLFDEKHYKECSLSLQHATILTGDFEIACRNLMEHDFVYFDSPYYDTFDTYQAGGFPEHDHIRLFELFNQLSERGVYCLLSNSDTEFIRDLYQAYNIRVVPVKRMISCNGENRDGTEIIISNF